MTSPGWKRPQTISQPSLDLLIPTVRRPNSEIWFTWHPRSARDPVDAMFRGVNPPNDRDPSVLVRSFIHEGRLYIDHEAYAIGCEIENTPALFAGDDVRPHPGHPNDFYQPTVEQP